MGGYGDLDRMKVLPILKAVALFIFCYSLAAVIPQISISFINFQEFGLGYRLMMSGSAMLIGFYFLLTGLMKGGLE
jgi:hypothetical protein